jgi:serine O-acetyltransferase
VVGERARVGANAVVTDDVPEGATMIGLKARSTLIPAETWLKEFIPYGTPCEEPCDNGNGSERIQQLEFELGLLRAEIEALKEGTRTEEVAAESAARKRSAKR